MESVKPPRGRWNRSLGELVPLISPCPGQPWRKSSCVGPFCLLYRPRIKYSVWIFGASLRCNSLLVWLLSPYAYSRAAFEEGLSLGKRSDCSEAPSQFARVSLLLRLARAESWQTVPLSGRGALLHRIGAWASLGGAYLQYCNAFVRHASEAPLNL